MVDDSHTSIQIKGLRDGLLVSLGDAEWPQAREALLEHIQTRQAFFRGARLALDVGSRVFHVNELAELRDQLSEHGVTLWAVISQSPTTEKTAQLLGLATRISRPRPPEPSPISPEALGENTALWVVRTLRSGTRLEVPGHVVIVGDVNPGAEVIAEGSILVWGRVRGLLHAGAGGDETAFVCGLDLSTAQVRIGRVVGLSTLHHPMGAEGEVRPQKVIVKDGLLRFEPWQATPTKGG